MTNKPNEGDEYGDIDDAIFPDEISDVIEGYAEELTQSFNDDIFYLIDETTDKIITVNLTDEQRLAVLAYVLRRLKDVSDIFLTLK